MTIPMIIERMLMMQNDINRLRLRIEKLEKEPPKSERLSSFTHRYGKGSPK